MFHSIWAICSKDFVKFGIIAKKAESTCILRETIVKYKNISDTAALFLNKCSGALMEPAAPSDGTVNTSSSGGCNIWL